MRRTVRSVRGLARAAIALLLVTGVVAIADPAYALTVTVTGATPGSLGQGATGSVVSVTGTGFSNTGGSPVASVSGTGVTVTNTALVDSTHLNVTINVSPTAPVGARNVTVNQGPGGVDSGTCTGCLTINVGPSISGVVPASGGQNALHEVVGLTGANFAGANGAPFGGTVAFSGTGITVNGVTPTHRPTSASTSRSRRGPPRRCGASR